MPLLPREVGAGYFTLDILHFTFPEPRIQELFYRGEEECSEFAQR